MSQQMGSFDLCGLDTPTHAHSRDLELLAHFVQYLEGEGLIW